MKKLNHQPLAEFLAYLQTDFQVSICINDFVGFIPLDKELDLVLQPYMAHKNPFCMYIKKDKQLMQKCLGMKRKLLSKSLHEGKHFCGICHAGAGEFIYPVFYDKQLLGIINIGMFDLAPQTSRRIIHRLCKRYSLDHNTLLNCFDKSMKVSLDTKRQISLDTNINFLCSYLSNCFYRLSSDFHAAEFIKNKHNSSEDFILSHCIGYIQEHYKETVDVSTLKSLCHCSESFINHIFKKRTGNGVRTYVNKLRMEEAKRILSSTSDSISLVAERVGFSDPDYFSRVFAKEVGISPKLYRERFKVIKS